MIVVPNMRKPKICYMCPLSDETGFCPIVGEAIPRANRKLVNCPLIDIATCGECKHSKEWYGDRRLCYLWAEEGIPVFENGFCNYGKGESQ